MQAEALRRAFAVERAKPATGKQKRARIHFVDVFSLSAALHWTHCDVEEGDPVHFKSASNYKGPIPAYVEMWRLALRAAKDLC